MKPDHLSSVPSFTIGGVTFRCWVTDGGRYEWRSTCGRFFVGRIGRDHWARVDGKTIGDKFASLKIAMQEAIQAVEEAAA